MNDIELRDALTASSCDEKIIGEITSLIADGNTAKAKTLLEKHRKNILDEVHSCEKSIECIDYLIYKLKD